MTRSETMNVYPSLSAMDAFSTGLHGAAYNIANVNTDGFNPVAVHYRSGSPDDQGVRAVVTRPGAQGDAVDLSPEAMAAVNPSNTDVAREMTHMMADQRAFEANAAVIRTYDEVAGTVLDIKA